MDKEFKFRQTLGMTTPTFKTLKRFDIPSLCKIAFFLDLIFIAIFIVPFTLIFMMVPHKPGTPNVGFVPLVLLFIHPIMAVMMAAIGGALYNLISSKTGGIKVEVE